MSNIRHITLPGGFVAAGVKCGIKASGNPDLAIIAGAAPVSAAVMTTSNQVVGAPVLWCRKALPRGFGRIRGMVINAGCSNVCTGAEGRKNAAAMAAQAAKGLGATAGEVLVASTGIIGHQLPMAKVRIGIADALGQLGTRLDQTVIRSIMTTDTREKSAVVQVRIGGKCVTLAGIIKGAGMIAPHLATMICVVTTDADIAPTLLNKLWREAVSGTVNAVTVDSDESTSDTAVIMASGASGATVAAGATTKKFAQALHELLNELAMAMARDGEGATKLVVIRVSGAVNDAQARIAALSVANSPLFKCAVHGGDPNWGRILCALGKSSAKVDQDRATVSLGGVKVFVKGTPQKYDLKAVETHLAGTTVEVDANLALGKGQFTAYTCDFSREYITINADYHT